MIKCGTYPATMQESGGHIGGVSCKNGMILGRYVLVQNFYEASNLALAEVLVYGIEMQ